MQAAYDFTAHINGANYALKKGDKFEGCDADAEQLKAMGMLEAEQKPVKAVKADKTKEVQNNER